jgi:hypothetical protein
LSTRLRRLAAVALVFAVAVSVGVAHADGPRTLIVVARGRTLEGAPWAIRFGEEAGRGGEPALATFLFQVGTRAELDECECGYYSSFTLPLPKAFVFGPTFGSDFDRYPEADASGIAGPRVKRIAVTAADGSVYETEPVAAPARLTKRFPHLRPFRFFDLFFPVSAEPTSIAAYGPGGQVLKRFSRAETR